MSLRDVQLLPVHEEVPVPEVDDVATHGNDTLYVGDRRRWIRRVEHDDVADGRRAETIVELAYQNAIVLLERTQDTWLAKWSGTDRWLTQPIDPFELAQEPIEPVLLVSRFQLVNQSCGRAEPYPLALPTGGQTEETVQQRKREVDTASAEIVSLQQELAERRAVLDAQASEVAQARQALEQQEKESGQPYFTVLRFKAENPDVPSATAAGFFAGSGLRLAAGSASGTIWSRTDLASC